MRITALVFALLFGVSGGVFANGNGYDKDSPTDNNNGRGNDPGKSGKAPGHTLLYVPGSIVVAVSDNVAPGSGNWGGGPGNSGPGDKNGQNDKSKDGGQTPNDDK